MHRTQIHLGDEELRLLELAGAATGASRSALIRRAIIDVYGAPPGRSRPWPRSIGIASTGRIDATQAKEWVRREWDRRWPPPEEQAG